MPSETSDYRSQRGSLMKWRFFAINNSPVYDSVILVSGFVINEPGGRKN